MIHETVLELLAGNHQHTAQVGEQLDELQVSQRPDIVTVCCGDSRVLQDAMWDNDTPGRVFTHSNIGNRVIQDCSDGRIVTGDVLYPLVHTETDVAVVVGHTGCGAVTAAYDAMTDGIDEVPGIAHCISLLERVLEPGFERLSGDLDREEAINRLVEYNVDRQAQFLVESDQVPDSVQVIGVVYDFHDVYGGRRGELHVLTVDGVRDVDSLREAYPDIESRIRRHWEY